MLPWLGFSTVVHGASLQHVVIVVADYANERRPTPELKHRTITETDRFLGAGGEAGLTG
jgi:hypothetical protein